MSLSSVRSDTAFRSRPFSISSSSARLGRQARQSPCACRSLRPRARHSCSKAPGSSRQASDQPGQRLGIVRIRCPEGDARSRVRPRSGPRRRRPAYPRERSPPPISTGRKHGASVADWSIPARSACRSHLKIRLTFQSISPCHLRDRHIRCYRLQIDRFSSSDQSRRVRRATPDPIVSTKQSGHYPNKLYHRLGGAALPQRPAVRSGQPAPTETAGAGSCHDNVIS